MKSQNSFFAIALVVLAVLLFAACVPPEVPAESENAVAQEAVAQIETEAGQAEAAGDEFPIEVLYFTPAQTEGPFYPVEKLTDRDNDLFVLEGADGSPAGEVLAFGGRLYDGTGMPIPGAVIEIWQTDDNGIYLHPGDSNSPNRDANFQSYGEAITGEDGGYTFRTVMPGGYDPRPRHIHVKVKVDGQEVLTTQFYFSNDPQASADSIFARTGEEVEALIMEIEEGIDFEGNRALIGRRDIILRMNLSE